MSVIIPSYRRPDLLARQLAALAAQDYTEPWEVVVADNGGGTGATRVAASFVGRLDVSVIDASGCLGAAAARNEGAAAARADLLLFLDDDDEADPAYVRRMAVAMGQHPFVAGQLDHERLNRNWVARALQPWQTERLMDMWGFLPHASGAAIGIRREVFDSVGGWPEGFCHSEDVALCWAVGLTGGKLRFVEGAVVHYRHRSSVAGYLDQEWRSAFDDLQLYERFGHHGMPFPEPGWGLGSRRAFLGALARARSAGELLVLVGAATRVLGRYSARALPGARRLARIRKPT